jgi:membrane protein
VARSRRRVSRALIGEHDGVRRRAEPTPRAAEAAPGRHGVVLTGVVPLETVAAGVRPTSVVSREATQVRAAATAAEAARPPTGNPLRWFGRTVADVLRKADRDRMLALAAETAFFAVLTLFPALLVATAVLGQLQAIVGRRAARQVEDAVLDLLDRLLTEAAAPVVEQVAGLFNASGNLLTLASVLALVALSTAFATVINTLNITYDVPETRGWWRRRLLGLLLGIGTVLTGTAALLLLVVGPLFGRGIDIVTAVGLGEEYVVVWQHARGPVAFLLLVLWATTLDHLTPAQRGRWRHNLPGGLLTALLWFAASFGLSVYLQIVVPASPVLGALGGGLILMSWFYLLSVALLAGAELNAILMARRSHRRARRAAAKRAAAEQQAQRQDGAEPAAGRDSAWPDETGPDETGRHATAQDGAGQAATGRDAAGRDGERQDGEWRDGDRQDGEWRDGRWQDAAGQEPYEPEPPREDTPVLPHRSSG